MTPKPHRLPRYWRTGALLAILYLSGCVALEPITPRVPLMGVYHTVKEGETLFAIALVYGIDPDRLARINRVADPDKLKAGAKLWIPGALWTKHVPVLHGHGRGKVARKPPRGAHKHPGPPPKKGALLWPVKGGVITSKFGRRHGRNHEGIDIGARKGTPVYAADSGKVMFSGWGPTGYGKMVIVKHNGRLTTVYAHNSKNLVKKNSRVKRGQVIARVGSTGRSTGPHLHFEVRNDTHPKNPLPYLGR